MNYYQFHIGDYAADTRHLTWTEDLAYRRLMDVYYRDEQPLPPDEKAIFRLVLATTDDQRDAVRIVLQEFFELTALGWMHRRCDAELAKYHEKSAKARHAVNSRWQYHQDQSTSADHTDVLHAQYGRNTDVSKNHTDVSKTDTDVIPTNNQEPLTNNQDKNIGQQAAIAQPTRAKRAQHFPDGFLPNDSHREKAHHLGVDLDNEFEGFQLHHRSKGNKFVDWNAALMTWLRNAAKYSRGSPGIKQPVNGRAIHNGIAAQNWNQPDIDNWGEL